MKFSSSSLFLNLNFELRFFKLRSCSQTFTAHCACRIADLNLILVEAFNELLTDSLSNNGFIDGYDSMGRVCLTWCDCKE